jgi:medium-chain acyl-[acyl-carrier-protein] hydrolase
MRPRTNSASPWFRYRSSGEPVDLKLFCFPYAGGRASIYSDWANHLPSGVQVVPVELPGRGAWLRETPWTSFPPLIDALADAIQPHLEIPFAFFGHSMGSMIAFELSRLLRSRYGREPQTLFASGRRAPQVPDDQPATYDLPKDEFIAELRRIGGTPKEVLEHDELMELMIPLLRADFRLVQTYKYFSGAPLRCPITVFGGLEDCEETRDLLLAWKEQTISEFTLHQVPGDHFFLRSSQSFLLGLLSRELEKVIARSRSITAKT